MLAPFKYSGLETNPTNLIGTLNAWVRLVSSLPRRDRSSTSFLHIFSLSLPRIAPGPTLSHKISSLRPSWGYGKYLSLNGSP
ncbi:hypothetical protein K443DRAFT_515500 [Laccaria amethystina LaAM-08-1]|uniref:Uncharacterized protein n=1 Tax=Laccaria amethystina LaAM-08-1 TaxID=1095629 RepID=A0A0C9XY07_9AGAR|nr:hypothetical protein K443DRAFT_515500 [Laccaria amethystina LaAM-08-1]